MMVRVANFFPAEQIAWLKRRADAQGIPRAELMRRIVAEYIAAQPEPERKQAK